MRPAWVRIAPQLAWGALGAWLLWSGLVHVPGPHDNDWPLLMWLVKHASVSDPSSLAIGHYGPLQLLLAWWLYPVFGGTLAAAKVLSTLGVLGSVAALYLMTRRDHGEMPALMAATAFGLSAPALLTGQSEFADALACGSFLVGLCLWWRGEERRGLVAGLCLGAAGLMRTHFVIFSIGAALLAALLGVLLPSAGGSRREQGKSGAWLLCGALLGNLPGFLLNLRVHGQLGSAVADTFLGQVLYGVDDYDFLETYAAHPLGQILRDHPEDILRLMSARARENVELWLVPLVTLGIALWKLRRWPAAIVRHVLLFSLLGLAYFGLFVSLAWWVSPRLAFPITSFNYWLIAAVSLQLGWGAFRYSRGLCSAAFALALAWELSSSQRQLQARWGESSAWWDASTELTQNLRQQGMTQARQAFVFDWNRFVVDDPELQPFYNFGFWNLLLPEFRAERPIPTPYLGDLRRLAEFLKDHGVRFFVLPQDRRLLRRFPALARLAEGRAELPGFRRGSPLARDVWFLYE
ncbi:MAG TPA: hypothetical protein VJU61_26685 [Polyangiaceae bacterium]|nr:hypothetical protein [Polyangiaceae bacterium]